MWPSHLKIWICKLFYQWRHTSLLSKTPVVQNSNRVCADRFDSRRIWYPTASPSSSPLSAATLAATETADIRRGWVQIMLQSEPRRLFISSSSMNCGSWVVLPQPVSPEMTRTWYRKAQQVKSGKKKEPNGQTNKSNSFTKKIRAILELYRYTT